MTNPFIIVVLSYLAGSIPTAVWVSKIFYKQDIRELGSRNAGLTNIYRVFGIKAAVPVGIVDLGKGLATTLYGYSLKQNFMEGMNFALLCGGICILGHTFTVFENFKGGKGVLTALGVFLVLIPYSALSAFAIWMLILWFSGYVSLASIVASIAILGFALIEFNMGSVTSTTLAATLALCVFIIMRHRTNIKRLLTGTENKFGTRGK